MDNNDAESETQNDPDSEGEAVDNNDAESETQNDPDSEGEEDNDESLNNSEEEQSTITIQDIKYEIEGEEVYDSETCTKMGTIDPTKSLGISWIKSAFAEVHMNNITKLMEE